MFTFERSERCLSVLVARVERFLNSFNRWWWWCETSFWTTDTADINCVPFQLKLNAVTESAISFIFWDWKALKARKGGGGPWIWIGFKSNLKCTVNCVTSPQFYIWLNLIDVSWVDHIVTACDRPIGTCHIQASTYKSREASIHCLFLIVKSNYCT